MRDVAREITRYRRCAERGEVDGSIHLNGALSWQAAYERELTRLCDTGKVHGPVTREDGEVTE